MTALRKRAYALENKFAHDQELLFRAEARRNALIGLWAAAAMRRAGAEDYAREIVALGVENPASVLTRLNDDFTSAGIVCLSDEINDRMTTMLKQVADEMYTA